MALCSKKTVSITTRFDAPENFHATITNAALTRMRRKVLMRNFQERKGERKKNVFGVSSSVNHYTDLVSFITAPSITGLSLFPSPSMPERLTKEEKPSP